MTETIMEIAHERQSNVTTLNFLQYGNSELLSDEDFSFIFSYFICKCIFLCLQLRSLHAVIIYSANINIMSFETSKPVIVFGQPRPFLVNELKQQHLLHDRRKVYEVCILKIKFQIQQCASDS